MFTQSANEPAHPLGSRDIGNDLMIPLTPEGKVDPAVCKEHPDYCRFIGLRRSEDDEADHLVSRPGGSWAFHYDPRGEEDDAAGFHFENERFVVGEYVSAGEEDGCRTYVLASVEKF
jgi:hypothetical protein